MAFRRNTEWYATPGAIVVTLALLGSACQASHPSAPEVRDPTDLVALRAEVQRISNQLGALENQLQQAQRQVASARLETQHQRERVVMLEDELTTRVAEPVAEPPRASVAVTMEAEAELRLAYHALMRAIERLDISTEEKAALKNSLRPTRSLDRDNPWAIAQH